MSHFNLKSLAFYGTMIGSVLILFKAVTTYGDNNLKAPDNISGNYQFNDISLNDCLKDKTVNLTISQSGRYLGGVLSLTNPPPTDSAPVSPESSVETSENRPEEISLSGLLSSPITLNNQKTSLANCPGQTDQLRIEIQPEAATATGTLYWSSLKQSFTAEKIANKTTVSH